jgi:hypothetical protein
VPVRKELLLKGADYYYRSSFGDLGQKMKVGVFIEFDNKESAQLGMPLPKGIIRVYKKDGRAMPSLWAKTALTTPPRTKKCA